MHEKKFILLVFAGILVISLLVGVVLGLPDGKLHIVFCNVGQGDGIYIRMPDGKNVVIDGGPNNKILSCLGNRMAFWDRGVDLMVLTHPHQDHFTGLMEILKRYQVKNIVVPTVNNSESESYSSFIKLVTEEGTTIKNLYQGEKIEFGIQNPKSSAQSKIVFTSLWPTHDWVAERVNTVLNSPILAAETAYNDLNDFSEVLQMTYGTFDILFTGDAESSILEQIKSQGLLPQDLVEVIKVPHQGNKNALTEDLISYIHPKLGVIMVGKNSYGHPAPQTIQLLLNHNAISKRTDHDGDVEVISDGRQWWLKN